MQNLKFRVAADGPELTFYLVSETDEILLTGGNFADREACVAGIQAIIDVAGDEDRYDILPAPDGSILRLTALDGQLLAQTRPLSDEDAADALRESLVEAASEQEAYDIALPGSDARRSLRALPFAESGVVDWAGLYDFARFSVGGQPGFELFQAGQTDRFYFHVNDAQGVALLFSREFRAVSQRNQRMRMVAKNGVLPQRYERREEDGRHFFILKARNGQEIARSRAFAASAEMETALAWLLTEMAVFAGAFARKSAARSRRKDGFNLGLISLSTEAGFELLRNAQDKLYYFLFHGDDGATLLYSQGYGTRAGRDKAIQTVIRLSANPARYEAHHAKPGRVKQEQAKEQAQEYAFALRARNNQLIARSRDFEDADAADAVMRAVQTQIATYAAAFGVAFAELESAQGEQITLYAEREAEEQTTPALETTVMEASIEASIEASMLKTPAEPAAVAPAVPLLAALPLAAAVSAAIEPAATIEARAVEPDATEPMPIEDTRQETAAAAATVDAVTVEAVALEAVALGQENGAAAFAVEAALAGGTPNAIAAEDIPVSVTPPATPPQVAPILPVTKTEDAKSEDAPAVVVPLAAAERGAKERGAKDRDTPRRKPFAFGWLACAVPLLLLLCLLPFLPRLLRPTSANSGAGTAGPKAGSGTPHVSAPDLASNATAGPNTPPGANARPTVGANALVPPVSRTAPAAQNAAGLVVRPGHGSPVVMETALAAYLSGAGRGEPRAFTMTRLAYPPNSHEVNAAGKDEIRDLARVLMRFPTAKIVLHGHLDGREQEAYHGPNPRLGYPLSKLRPDCVCRRLHFLGVSYDRMQIVGDGRAQPTGDDATEDGRQQNRRIDITVSSSL